MQVYVEMCTSIECILNVDIIECTVMQTYATTTECAMNVTTSVCIKMYMHAVQRMQRMHPECNTSVRGISAGGECKSKAKKCNKEFN